MSADELLMMIYKAGCECSVGPEEDTHCFYCVAWLDVAKDGKPYDEHDEDCTYVLLGAYLREAGLIS